MDYIHLFEEKRELINGLYTPPPKITKEWIDSMFLDNQSSFFIWGWCYRDISKLEFSTNVTTETLTKISFDDQTSFPQKLPDGFNPPRLLKNTIGVPMQISALHAKGINGNGMSVAIVDSAFVPHKELESPTFHYKETTKVPHEHFHGLLTASILAGTNIGIVPKANCHFYAISQMTTSRDDEQVAALRDILSKIKQGEKICVASLSMPYPKTTRDEYYELIEQLKEVDCEVIDSGKFNTDFICGRFTSPNIEELELIDLNDWQRDGEWKQVIASRIVVPSAGRMLPLWGTEDRYHYCAQSGVSWSIPILAGLYCLAKQQNALLDYETFVVQAKRTVYRNKAGLQIINPLEFIT